MKKQIFAGLIFLSVLICPAYSAKFKIAVLPDTQNYSEEFPEIFTKQTQWIVANKTAESIEFVTHLGDIVEEGATQMFQWANANTSMSYLDGVVPYSACIGNHDYDIPHNKIEGGNVYKTYFGASRYSGYNWYKGTSPGGLSHYQIFSAGGRDWLHLNLEYESDTSIFMWAQDIIDAYSTLPIIISTHSYIGMRLDPTDPCDWGSRASAGVMFYRFVSHNDQIFMILCGHYNGEESTKLQNDYGNDVFFLLTDYQFGPTGGSGWLRMYEFDLDNNQINATTYSPWLNQPTGQYQTDANSQFTLNIDFNERLSNFGSREDISGIQAGNVNVIENDNGNYFSSVDVFIPEGQKTADFNVVDYDAVTYAVKSKGDYSVQIGSLCDDDMMGGVLITSVAENGRLDTSGVDYKKYHTSTANLRGRGYFSIGVDVTSMEIMVEGLPMVVDGFGEGNVNVSAAYFPFSEFIGAHCELMDDEDANKIFSTAGNGVVLGQNFTQYPVSPDEASALFIQKPMPLEGEPDWDGIDGNRGIYELTLPGVNSMTDGIILASAGGDVKNYVICSPHPDGSGWQLATKTNTSSWGGTYCNAFSFVYVPYDTPGIVAGRVRGTGQSTSGTGGYRIEAESHGRHILKIYGKTPADGALLLTGESQYIYDGDIHTYQPDDVNGCWVIESRRLREANLVSIATYENYVFAFVPFDGAVAPFEGSGTLEDPYEIYTKEQLEAVDWWPTAHFKLMNNIDLAGTTYTNSLIGIDVNDIDNGFNGVAFTGSLNGNGFAIQNLTMNGVNQDRIGLFGEIGTSGQVSNLTLQNVNIVSNSTLTGALAGVSRGYISNCHVIGTIQGGLRVGGLAGYCSGTIINCDSAAVVTGTGIRVGGLIGNSGTLTASYCFATGNVSSTGTENVGGLIGECASSNLDHCYSTGDATGGSETNNVGGLLGYCDQTNVSNCWSNGNVTTGGFAVGGFIGCNMQSSIATSYATGTALGIAEGTYGHHVGGFVGSNEGVEGSVSTITDCYAIGSATGTKLVGGFIGRALAYSSISGCYATGNAAATAEVDDAEVGGFAGRMGGGSIANCYATGSAGGYARVGGFAGRHYGDEIVNCYSTGTVSGTSYVRGFVGYGSNTVTNSFWDTETSGTTSSVLGVGKTTAQMKMQSTFTGWGFPTVWKIREDVSYPRLSWQEFGFSDIDMDGTTDFADLKVIADNWLATGTNLPGDIHIDANNIVNFLDFADFAEVWCNQ